MGNSIWYILLCFASITIFTYTLWKKKDKRLIVFYFFIAGLTYFLEYFVLVIFNGYVYHPNILQNKYFDNIMGAIVSDGFVIPMTTTFIAAFNANFKTRLLFVLTITFIEVIFVNLNIYEHNWWKYIYTFIGGILLYSFGQRWYSTIQGTLNRFKRYATLLFANLAIQASIVFFMVSIFNLFFYNVNWFNNPYRGHVAFATLYIILITNIFVFLIVFQINWIGRIVGVLIPSIIDIILFKMNILTLSNSWTLLNFFFFRIIILTGLLLINKYFLSEVTVADS